MYFLYKSAWSGGSDVMGREPSEVTGTSPGHHAQHFGHLHLRAENPGDQTAYVDLDYFLVSGQNRHAKDIEVKPKSRFTIRRHDDNRASGGTTIVRRLQLPRRHDQGHPVVVDAPCTSTTQLRTGGHGVMGPPPRRRRIGYFGRGAPRARASHLCLHREPQVREDHSPLNLLQGRR